MTMFDPENGKLAHSGTFNNNVISMAAGVVGSGILTESVLRELNERGERLRTGIECLIETYLTKSERRYFGQESKMTVRGIGSLMTIAFKGPDKEVLQGLFYHHMLASGIYLAGRGLVALSIKIRDEDCTKFMSAVKDFMAKY